MMEYKPVDQREAAIKMAYASTNSVHDIMGWIMFFEAQGYKLCQRKEEKDYKEDER